MSNFLLIRIGENSRKRQFPDLKREINSCKYSAANPQRAVIYLGLRPNLKKIITC